MRCAGISRREKKRNEKAKSRTKRLSQRQGGAKITLTNPRHLKSSLPHTFYHPDTALTSTHANLTAIRSPTLHVSQRAIFRRLPGSDTVWFCRRENHTMSIFLFLPSFVRPNQMGIRWVWQVACTENTYRVVVKKHEETNSKT